MTKILVSSSITMTNLEPPLSMMKSGIITKNVIEQHKISSQITRVTILAHL